MNWSLSFLIQENQCSKNPCPLNNNCQNGFGDKGYRCQCQTGYIGEACDQCFQTNTDTCGQGLRGNVWN